MSTGYDSYYQTENLFGSPYPELLEFLGSRPERGRLLDLGCGQGRDAIPLARMGYSVVGIDSSAVGIEQMNRVSSQEKLDLMGRVDNIYDFQGFNGFDVILLDSMFHFEKKDRSREIQFIERIIDEANPDCLIVFCIQDTGEKVNILKKTLGQKGIQKFITDRPFNYTFEDSSSGHRSSTPYRMISIERGIV